MQNYQKTIKMMDTHTLKGINTNSVKPLKKIARKFIGLRNKRNAEAPRNHDRCLCSSLRVMNQPPERRFWTLK
jgi:hypothetical protein